MVVFQADAIFETKMRAMRHATIHRLGTAVDVLPARNTVRCAMYIVIRAIGER